MTDVFIYSPLSKITSQRGLNTVLFWGLPSYILNAPWLQDIRLVSSDDESWALRTVELFTNHETCAKWSIHLKRGVSQSEAIVLVGMEIYKLRLSESAEERVGLSKEQVKDCVIGCVGALKARHPVRYSELFRASGLLPL